MVTNPELELAYEYVSQTNRHVFLTGKAGTGKTTFLHRIRAEVPKRMAVVAPTGVAAINAKGVTIHSLFQLPFGVLLPGVTTERSRQFSAKKKALIQGLDLLVIDEISMVRADVLDGIDEVLRRLRRSKEPFGGLQLLMIGDLHQLPPVVKDADWYQMREHYDTAYFFGSRALRAARPATIQLKHIYRQSDETFINLLNKVRNNQLDQSVFDTLNQRYIPDFEPADEDGYITLSSHNNTARRINSEQLSRLPGKAYRFQAEVEDNFPESMYPNTAELTFKVGAQVMFNKNDTLTHAYYNGKIGKITAIEEGQIVVQCPGDEGPIYVEPVVWENRKFEMNSKTKEVEDAIIGTYTQHPLKLAWAITIHKSQGLTFEKVVIDAEAAFAHGQVYVALSRCKTFEGIVLRSKIGGSSVKTDTVVKNYSAKAEENQPGDEELLADKRAFQINCLRQLFAGEVLLRASQRLNRALLENERYLQGGATADFARLHRLLNEQVITVGKKFLPHLSQYAQQTPLPEDNAALRERLSGAADYFLKLLTVELGPGVDGLEMLSDNKKILSTVQERHQELQRELFVTTKLFKTIQKGFDPLQFVRHRADAGLDFDQLHQKTKRKKRSTIPKEIPHPALYARLNDFRGEHARAEEVRPSSVISTAALLEINYVLPTKKKSLLAIKGFGAKRFEYVGEQVLSIIREYTADKDLETDHMEFAKGAKAKEDTKAVTLELYKAGKDVAAIATARKMAQSTIEGHLSHWIGLGEVPATDFMEQQELDYLVKYFAEHPEERFGETFTAHDGKYSYGQLRIAQSYRTFLKVIGEQGE